MVEDINALPLEYELDEYRVESVLSTDRIGIFYKALDKYLETQVIIREYFPAQAASRGDDGATVNPILDAAPENPVLDYDAGLEQFLEEARALARLQEPAVAQVKRCFKANNTIYMILEHREEPLLAPDAAPKRAGAKKAAKSFSPTINAIPGKINAFFKAGDLKGSVAKYLKNPFAGKNLFAGKNSLGDNMARLFTARRLKIAGITIVALIVMGGSMALWLREPDDNIVAGKAPRYVLKDGFLRENKEAALPQRARQEVVNPADEEGAAVPPRGEEIDDIPQLLKLAQDNLNAYRLTTPERNNAVYYYRRALAFEPENQVAKDGLYEVATRYGWLAKREMNNENFAKAKRFVALGLTVDPEHPRLLDLKKELGVIDQTQVRLR